MKSFQEGGVSAFFNAQLHVVRSMGRSSTLNALYPSVVTPPLLVISLFLVCLLPQLILLVLFLCLQLCSVPRSKLNLMRALDAQLLCIVVCYVCLYYIMPEPKTFPFYANLMDNKVDVPTVLHDGTILLELGC